MNEGYIDFPLRFIIIEFLGASTDLPTAIMLPFLISIDPSSIIFLSSE